MTTVQEQVPTPGARRSGYSSVADAVGAAPRRAATRPSTRRQNVVLTLTATVLGLWFGLAAPSVSPVAPPAPALSSAAGADQAAAAPDAAAPAAPADPADSADPAGADPRDGQRGRTPFGQGRH